MVQILLVEKIFWNPWSYHKIQCHHITYLCIQRIK